MNTSAYTELEALWHSQRPSLTRHIARRVDIFDVEDILQTVFLRAWAAILRGNGYTDHPRAWIFRIAANTVIDYWRKRERAVPTISLDGVTPDVDYEGFEPARLDDALTSPELSPHERATSEIGCEVILSAVRQLTPEHQQVLALTVDGYRSCDVGDAVGIGHDAGKARLHRARARLQQLMESRGYE